MDMVERQPQNIIAGVAQAPASTVRLGGFEQAGKGEQASRAGGDTPRHVRDILADFLQYDVKG